MSSVVATMNKKRSSFEAGAAHGQAAKKVANDTSAAMAAPACMSGVPGWQYPPLPMGMVPPMPGWPMPGMPGCMAGNPFFPFMGMFPPFWMPAMAATSMPALAAASAVGTGTAGVSSMSGACALPAAMWPLMSCAPVVAPPVVIPPSVACVSERTCSAASSDIAFPSTSCANSMPTVGGIHSPASPPPLAASPLSVCNGISEHQAEDDEFANFIDSFLRSGDNDLTESAIASGLKVFQPAGASSSGASNCSDSVNNEELCLTRSDSLLHLLSADMEAPGVC